MGMACLRSTLTLLHGMTGLAAGFFCLYTLFTSTNPPHWIPKLVDRSGLPIPFRNGLPVLCDTIVYGTGAVCLLNFMMCVVNNCLYKSACVAVCHVMLTSCYLAFSVLGGAVVTVYYLVWCDVLQQAVPESNSCTDAAATFDMKNSTTQMKTHKSQMEIQMASIWTMLPLTCFALVTYALALLVIAEPDTPSGQQQPRYILVQNERTPLLHVNGSLNVTRDPSISNHSQPSVNNEESANLIDL